MQLARPAFAMDPRRFGRGPNRTLGRTHAAAAVASDLKLFMTTFVAGFLFVSVLIG